MITKSYYNGGTNGWGQIFCECAECGVLVSVWETDDNGVPIKALWNDEDSHECEWEDDEE